jgi:CRISPR-associated protein Cmr6
MAYPYNGSKLIKLLQQQHIRRTQSDLFRSGTFTLNWRTKVGSSTAPDVETLISAGERCGSWSSVSVIKRNRINGSWQEFTEISRPEDKREVGENWESLRELPLHGYIPGASIRGVVRAWARQFPNLQSRVTALLGNQIDRNITPGKIEFLDAFPMEPTKLSLDIVNPQQNFQVFHQGQGTPLSLYTLGDGWKSLEFLVGIRGIPGQATLEEINEVWNWVQQALMTQGIGSRRASGYGSIKRSRDLVFEKVEGYSTKTLHFSLYSQGCAGPNTKTPELRPAHWRGWLRSWLMRFFLGVMTIEHAKATVGELLGTLEEGIGSSQHQGCVRLSLIPKQIWGEYSETLSEFQRFYAWEGRVEITAPIAILNELVLPIIRVAVSISGLGRGTRRPLHKFVMERNGQESARGSHLLVKHKVATELKSFGAKLGAETLRDIYQNWCNAVQQRWSSRFQVQNNVNAEVFSPTGCAVYLVPGPVQEPIEFEDFEWKKIYPNRSTGQPRPIRPQETRGAGMELIYQPQYKRKPEVGGDAASGNAHCSWVSIRRIKRAPQQFGEVVCVFMGQPNPLRQSFLRELAQLDDAEHLFGVRPNN